MWVIHRLLTGRSTDFLAVCKSFIDINMTKAEIILFLIIIYITDRIILRLMSILGVQLKNGKCENMHNYK